MNAYFMDLFISYLGSDDFIVAADLESIDQSLLISTPAEIHM